jgi:hypothetical protein
MMGLDGAEALVGGGGGGAAALGLPSLIGGQLTGRGARGLRLLVLQWPSSLIGAVTPCTEKTGSGQALFTKLKMMLKKPAVWDGRW